MPPKWEQQNLTKHYIKHPAGKDADCWQDLLGKAGNQVTESEYESESVDVCSRRWLEYRAEQLDVESVAWAVRQGLEKPFHPRRRYYVDKLLLTTVTSSDGQDVVTCYHEHFDAGHVKGGHKVPVGELKERYRKKIEVMEEKSKTIRNIETLHDEP